MTRPPKFFFNGAIYFVTTSVEEGFMFPPNETTKEVILKSLAQAQKLHDVEILDIIVQPTHVHLMIRAIDPSDLSSFMKCFKCEVAHAINGILGRGSKTVWCSRYDSPYIPDLATAMAKIAYIYANPSNDNAVDTIDQFPGFNTFHLRESIASGVMTSHEALIATHYIPRPEFTKIKNHTPEGYKAYRDRLIKNKKRNFLTLKPNALFHQFGITDEKEIKRLTAEILAEVRRREEVNRAQRQAEGRSLIGAKRLMATPIGAPYTPQRSGKRMRTHCNDLELRIETLTWMRELRNKARSVYERWKLGDFSVPFPMGLFPPAPVRLVEPLGW